ncbi:MAG: GerMN domain-containing protein [Bacillota bacterium]|nr:GerMN domain-containing protein [Bacillota bacterium]
MRLIINIFLIILIVFSLSIIPINYQIIDFHLSYLNKSDDIEIEAVETNIEFFNVSSTESNLFLTDNNFKVCISTSNKDELETIIDSFNIKISNPNEVVKTIKLKQLKNSYEKNIVDINEYLAEHSNQEIYTIEYNFYLRDLDLTSNYYTVLITSADSRVKENISYEFNYTNDNTYIGSSNKSPENMLYTKVYYADENFLRLVPVNKLINSTDRFIRATMNQLLETPDNKYGLSNTIIAPRIKNIYIHNKTARIDLNSYDVTAFNNGSANAMFALDSIINTIGKFSVVDKVKFFVDNKDNANYFHGTDLSEEFIVTNKSKAYVGLETTNKTMLLYPIEINEKNLNDKIVVIIKTLQGINYESNATASLIPTLPSNVKLLNYKFNDKNIELDFSKEFLTIYKENNNYNKLMYESILYSMTSIEGINSVSILVNSEKVPSFTGIKISEPQKPNVFINTLN